MRLFRRKQQTRTEAAPGQRAAVRRRPIFCQMEVKLLALEALQTGLTKAEVADIIGVAPITVSSWQKKYDAEGLPGLYPQVLRIVGPAQGKRFDVIDLEVVC